MVKDYREEICVQARCDLSQVTEIHWVLVSWYKKEKKMTGLRSFNISSTQILIQCLKIFTIKMFLNGPLKLQEEIKASREIMYQIISS